MSALWNSSGNYVSDILDEIALEGLDGITIEALWKRLSVRANFCFKIDENSKNFIWNIIILMKDVRFYELAEPRKELQYYDFFGQADHAAAAIELDEIYPYCSVKHIPGILGSCQDFFTRIDVTNQVVQQTLAETENLWGTKLVIVASQECRKLSLMGRFCCPNIDFSKCNVQYDVLERIGRTRHFGLATCGKGSLQSIVDDAKSIFYYVKFLINYKLVKKQLLFGSLQANPNASRVHLVRFYGEHVNDFQLILQTAVEELKLKPNYMMPYDEFYMLFEPEKRKRVHKYTKSAIFRKYVTLTKLLPYRQLFPNAKQSEWERKSKNGEKVIRCFQLIDPNIEVADIFDKEFDPEEEDGNSGFMTGGIYFKDMPIVTQAYYHIKNSGPKGLSYGELADRMGLCKSFVRAIIKRLLGDKSISSFVQSEGRLHCRRYIVGVNQQNLEAASEIAQIISGNFNKPDVEPGKDARQTEIPRLQSIRSNHEESHTTSNAEELGALPSLDEENVSYRALKRIGMIMKTIKTHRYRLKYQIMKYIMDEEQAEGYTTKIDRVTITKLLQKLVIDGLLKMVTLTAKGEKEISLKLYMDPAFEIDEETAETLFHKQSSMIGAESKKSSANEPVSLECKFASVLLENVIEMKKLLKQVRYVPAKSSSKDSKGSDVSYSPKFIRLSIIHDFMHYLVYDYNGIVDRSQDELIEELSKTCEIDGEMKKTLPRIYGVQSSSYLFVPPLSVDKNATPGWFLMSDFLTRLPLSIYVKILRVGKTTSELLRYLHHPIRKHFLVKDLPLSLRQNLMNRKQPFSSFHSDVRLLCFMGLLQFGIKIGKEHYHTLLRLNRKASILDTTSLTGEYYYQLPADVEFERKEYEFNKKDDVKKYWMDMFNVCLKTTLGIKANMIGKEIFVEREVTKESLKQYLTPVGFSKAIEKDDGSIPGDHLGAGGLDSAMFSFLRNNWIGRIKKNVRVQPKEPKVLKMPFHRIKKERPMRKRYVTRMKTNARKTLTKSDAKNATTVTTEGPRTARLRKIKKREVKYKRDRKIAYDEVDLEALKLMNTLRVVWSTAEDNFLLICRAAMTYLCPNQRTFVRIPWSEVRKVLQENLPESKNKTQKAIARRIVYMLKNPTTVRSVSLCLEELKQIPQVSEKFGCAELLNSIKPSAPNLEELQKKLYEKFHGLVMFMKDRFIDGTRIISVQGLNKDLLPDDLETCYQKYQFPTIKKSSLNIKMIREDVLRAILMSTLSCRSDKTSSAVQLFEIYRQYEDDELRNAIKKLHSDKVVTINKRANASLFKKAKYLPLSYSPYQLSFAFQHMLNMKDGHDIYTESFNQVMKLAEMNSEDESEIDLNDCNIALFLLACNELVFFKTTIPDQIIVLDSEFASDDAYTKMLERYREMLKFSNINSKFICTSGKIISRLNENKDGSGTKRPLENPEEESAKKQKTDDAENDEDPKEGASNFGEMDKGSNRSSRIALYMVREEAKKEINNDLGKPAQEFFVVNASKVFCTRKRKEIEAYLEDKSPKIINAKTKNIINRSSVPLPLVDEEFVARQFVNGGYGLNEVRELKETLRYIYAKKELGATCEEIRTNCKSSVLPQIIRHLIETKILIKSGIGETIYVAQKYCTPWLLNSFRLTRLEREKIKPSDVSAIDVSLGKEDEDGKPKKKKKRIIGMEDLKSDDYAPPSCSIDENNKVKMIIRPWIRIDGSLNRKVLDTFLGTILGYVVANPGASIKAVMSKFVPAITPVWTKDLVEILTDVGCVTLTVHRIAERCTLFSESVVELSDVYTGLEDDEFVAVEAKVDAINTLGLFIRNKSPNKDWFSD